MHLILVIVLSVVSGMILGDAIRRFTAKKAKPEPLPPRYVTVRASLKIPGHGLFGAEVGGTAFFFDSARDFSDSGRETIAEHTLEQQCERAIMLLTPQKTVNDTLASFVDALKNARNDTEFVSFRHHIIVRSARATSQEDMDKNDALRSEDLAHFRTVQLELARHGVLQ